MLIVRLAVASAALATSLLASPALADSPFDGTWKTDLSSIQRTPHLDVISIRHGIFTCASCTAPFAVPADGAFHAVNGQDDLDETAVRVIDADTVTETNRLKGRTVRAETITLSPDGKSAVLTFTDTINPGIAPVTGTQTLDRVAAGPADAHRLSGSWRSRNPANVSDTALTQTMKIEDGVLTLATGEGFSYAARLDGTPAATHGDPVVDTVSVRRVGERALAETDSGQDKIIATFTMTVSPDGGSLTTVWRNAKTGRVTSTTAHRI